MPPPPESIPPPPPPPPDPRAASFATTSPKSKRLTAGPNSSTFARPRANNNALSEMSTPVPVVKHEAHQASHPPPTNVDDDDNDPFADEMAEQLMQDDVQLVADSNHDDTSPMSNVLDLPEVSSSIKRRRVDLSPPASVNVEHPTIPTPAVIKPDVSKIEPVPSPPPSKKHKPEPELLPAANPSPAPETPPAPAPTPAPALEPVPTPALVPPTPPLPPTQDSSAPNDTKPEISSQPAAQPGPAAGEGPAEGNNKKDGAESDDDATTDEEKPLDLASMNAFEYERVAQNPAALRRYEQYRRSDLRNGKVKRVLQALNPSLSKVNDAYLIAVKGLAKMFVGDMTEMAVKIRRERGEKGPLQPVHLREAFRRLRKSGVFPSLEERSMSFM